MYTTQPNLQVCWIQTLASAERGQYLEPSSAAVREEAQDESIAAADADLQQAQQAEREGMQAVQQSLHTNQEGLLQARQGLQHQQGLSTCLGNSQETAP